MDEERSQLLYSHSEEVNHEIIWYVQEHSLQGLTPVEPVPEDKRYTIDLSPGNFDFSSTAESKSTLDNSYNVNSTKTLAIFTDGSFDHRQTLNGGCAFAAYHGGTKLCEGVLPLLKPISSTLTELKGIQLAALHLCPGGLLYKSAQQSSKIQIVSDAKSVVTSLHKVKNRRKIAQYELTFQLLQKIGAEKKLELCWVKGHSGNLGNNRADELAKLASCITHFSLKRGECSEFFRPCLRQNIEILVVRPGLPRMA